MNLSPEIQNQLNELSSINKKIEIESHLIERDQLILSIIIDKTLINLPFFESLDIIRFLLLIKPTYPVTPPSLYCISRFCLPELCDCRDLLEDTLQMKWDSKNCFLKLIISQIPSFIQRYLLYYNDNENIDNNDNNSCVNFDKRKLFGKYYLDSIYELTIIKYIPYLYFDVISEIVKIEEDENSMNIEDRKILITDNFVLLFCNKSLYELDQLKLVFIGPITSLIYIRQFITDGIVLLNWIIKGKQNNNNYFTMQLRTPDGDYIVDTLIDNLSKSSIKFKVTNKVNGNIKREGSVPLIEINLVEEEIKHLEKKITAKEYITKESISVLVNLYEKAVQYYSALNDEKFKIYVEKIHNIYSNNEYTLLLNMKTINKSNKEYNVGMFKRKRKNKNSQSEQGQGDSGKKKKEKNIKKKDVNNNKKIKNMNNNIKEEDNKESKIENKNEINKTINNKNEIKEDKNNNNNININNDNNIINNNKEENKVKKNREEGSKTYRKNRSEINNNNNAIGNIKSQRIFIDKKEIEEMIKNELNTNNNNIINNKEDKIDINKDKNIEKNFNLNRFSLNSNIFNLYKTLNQTEKKDEQIIFNNTTDKLLNNKINLRKINHQKTISYNFNSTRNLNNMISKNKFRNKFINNHMSKIKSVKRNSQNEKNIIQARRNKNKKEQKFIFIKNMFKNRFFDNFYYTQDNINNSINEAKSKNKRIKTIKKA